MITWVTFSVQNFGTLHLLFHQIKVMLLVFLCAFFPPIEMKQFDLLDLKLWQSKFFVEFRRPVLKKCWLCKNYVLTSYLLPIRDRWIIWTSWRTAVKWWPSLLWEGGRIMRLTPVAFRWLFIYLIINEILFTLEKSPNALQWIKY